MFDLVKVFEGVLERAKSKPVYEIGGEDVNVPDMIQYIKGLFKAKPGEIQSAVAMFERQTSRRAMICLFLAILEMAKRQLIEFAQTELFGDIGVKPKEGWELARSQQFDAIILDLMLPGKRGLDIVRDLRAEGIRTPVVLLTALGSIEERVAGLSAGADDYLVKPFAFPELMARIEAVCRRSGMRPSPTAQVGELCLDLATRRVIRAGDWRQVV